MSSCDRNWGKNTSWSPQSIGGRDQSVPATSWSPRNPLHTPPDPPPPPGHYPPLTPLSLAINPLNISHLTPHGHYTPSAFHVLGKLLFERWSLLVDNDIAQRAIALNPPPPRSRHWVALFRTPVFPSDLRHDHRNRKKGKGSEQQSGN